MTTKLCLHVGGPKSGTTFLQNVLQHNEQTLADSGVLVVGPRIDLIHAAMVVRGDKRLEGLPQAARGAWQRIVAQIRAWEGHSAIVSYELFAGASAEQARAALDDLDGIEVHVVVSARDLGKAIPSAWQERLKFGLTKPLRRWQPPAEADAHSEWGWRTMQPANVAARWGGSLPAERVHVVTVPADRADSTLLWSRFAEACGIADIADIDLTIDRANESLGVVEAELLRRVNRALDGRLVGGRQKSLWLRDVFAHRILAPIGREPIGLTDDHQASAQDQAETAIAAIQAGGYAIHGDLDDLRPERQEARLPHEVTEAELVESAALALADLLVWAREAGADPRADRAESVGSSEEQPGEHGLLGPAKRIARSTASRMAKGTKDRRARGLERRIAELEAEVRKQRGLQRRVAALQDLVQQLLLPASQQDAELTASMLRAYRKRSL